MSSDDVFEALLKAWKDAQWFFDEDRARDPDAAHAATDEQESAWRERWSAAEGGAFVDR